MPAEDNGQTVEDLADRLGALLREQQEKHPEAFARALDRTAAATGLAPQDIRALTAQRPDIAAMQASIPRPDPRSSTRLQAAAQTAAAEPFIEFGGSRFYVSGRPDVFDMAEVGEAFQALEDENALPALGAVNRLLRRFLRDYPGFRAKFREHHSSMSEEAVTAMGRVAQQFMEAVTGNPTDVPGSSSAGPSSTSTTSKGNSLSPERYPSTDPSGSAASTPG